MIASLPRLIRKNPLAFWLTTVLLGLILTGSGVAIFRNPSPPDRPEESDRITENLKRGQDYYQKGQYEDAKKEFEAVIKQELDSWQAWYGRGMASAALNEFDKQLNDCQRAALLNEQFAPIWNCVGEAFNALEKYPEAIEAFDNVIELTDNVDFQIIGTLNKGESFLENKQYPQAIKTIETALDLANSNQINSYNHFGYNLLGRAYREQQKYDKALEYYNLVISDSEQPYYYPARIGKGVTLNYLNKAQEALDTFKQILINQDSYDNFDNAKRAEVWYYKGLVFEKLNRCQGAIAAYKTAIQYRPNYPAAENAKQAAQTRCQ